MITLLCIVYWRDHSAGASRRRVTPMPRGSRPSTAAFTSSGARNASEIVMLTCRMLHLSRAAICSTLVTVLATISSSQRRPRAIDATSVARVSARMGRRSCGATDTGTMISRRRFIGVFFHGTRRTSRSLSTALRGLLGAFSALSSIASWSACSSIRTTWLRMRSRSLLSVRSPKCSRTAHATRASTSAAGTPSAGPRSRSAAVSWTRVCYPF
jgi:hypothetical protein